MAEKDYGVFVRLSSTVPQSFEGSSTATVHEQEGSGFAAYLMVLRHIAPEDHAEMEERLVDAPPRGASNSPAARPSLSGYVGIAYRFGDTTVGRS
ncbi:hypothetical protein [Bradyrhizobium sp. NBAIM01]|uniref:hypothetical protein n=1 Tax=Bradyrhizobium sp. NBAIM01 TaxID=2793818 RepID=UPI001CD712BC|nr:hypothetical protein [Bradyrhizobium sp. NBAIM01]MCA1516232.1 hypothetical protein [Bradyrhizobium sp. NBAIM01]